MERSSASMDGPSPALRSTESLTTPFDTFDDGYQASNAFMDAVNQSIADGKNSVAWCFTTMPSEAWKDGVGSALTAYAAGTGSWDDVVTAFVDGWASEYAAANE